MAAGIDDISIYIPQLYLDASDFAHARGLDPEKFAKNIPRTRQLIAIPAPMPIDVVCIRLIFLGAFCAFDLDEFSGGFVGYGFQELQYQFDHQNTSIELYHRLI